MSHKKKEKIGVRSKKLMKIPTEKLIYELTTRKGVFELGVGAFFGCFDIVHLYNQDPERHLSADRVFVLNPHYRKE